MEDTINTTNDWLSTVMEGFQLTIEQEEEEGDDDLCLSCLAEQFCKDNTTAMLSDALNLGADDPGNAALYLMTQRDLLTSQAQIVNSMLDAVIEMHPQILREVHHATEK
jgi:hypothetical protein